MCNRTKSEHRAEIYAERYGYKTSDLAAVWQPKKGQTNGYDLPYLPVLSTHKPDTIGLMRWGLVPYWADKADVKTHAQNCLNARSEGLETTASYRDAWRLGQRCILLCDGFYENRHERVGTKDIKPLYEIKRDDERPIALGCLFSIWRDPKATDERLVTFSIITTEANELLSYVHNSARRMPLVLDEKDFGLWLSKVPYDDDRIKALIHPYPDSGLKAERLTYLDKQGDLF